MQLKYGCNPQQTHALAEALTPGHAPVRLRNGNPSLINLLDARRAISVTERQRYILRVRDLARRVAQSYYTSRESLGFPGLENGVSERPRND